MNIEKSERRERRRFRRRHGMRVSGRSVLILAGVKRKVGKRMLKLIGKKACRSFSSSSETSGRGKIKSMED